MKNKSKVKKLFKDMKNSFWIDMSFITGALLIGLLLKWVVENNTLFALL